VAEELALIDLTRQQMARSSAKDFAVYCCQEQGVPLLCQT
jgi:hypothetical protein